MREAGYDPRAAISLQETFVRLSNSNKAGVFNTLFASHPPSQARVDANRASAAQLPAGGLGRSLVQSGAHRSGRVWPAFLVPRYFFPRMNSLDDR